MNTKDMIKLYNRIIARKLPPMNPDKYKGAKSKILQLIEKQRPGETLEQLRAEFYPDYKAQLLDAESKLPKIDYPKPKITGKAIDADAIQKYLETHKVSKPIAAAKVQKTPKAPKNTTSTGNAETAIAAKHFNIDPRVLRARLRKKGLRAPYGSAADIIAALS